MMAFIRKRLVAWLLPEIDRANGERIAHGVAAGALAGGRIAIVGVRRPDLFIPTGDALPPCPPRNGDA